jgi:hypothetical protein
MLQLLGKKGNPGFYLDWITSVKTEDCTAVQILESQFSTRKIFEEE